MAPHCQACEDGAALQPDGLSTNARAAGLSKDQIAGFGNSDGDLQMLQWTTAGPGARFGLIVRHTDAEREWAYDRNSSIGKLDKALDEAAARKWVVVDMRQDWKVIYPPEK